MSSDRPRTPHPADHSALFDLDGLMADDPSQGPLPWRAPAPRPAFACPPPRRNWVTILTVTAGVLAGGLALAAAGGIAWRMAAEPQPAPAHAVQAQAPAPAPTPSRATEAPPMILEPTPAPVEPPVIVAEPSPQPPAEPPVRAEAPRIATRPARRPQRARPARAIARDADPADRPEPRRARPETVTPPPEPAVAQAPEATGAAALDEVDRLLNGIPRSNSEQAPQPPAVVDSSLGLPEKLSRRQILHAVRRVGPEMARCPGEGTYRTTLKISPAGRVDAAQVTGDDPAARACVERAARGMRFPRFGGDPMSITLPFKI